MQKKLQSLQPAIISPKTKHKSTIIWLHGLGDSSDGFEMLMRQIIPSHTKCVIPNAPIRPITLNAGYPMRAWYDIASLNKREEEDVKSMLESKEILTALVDQEVKHVPSEKIILGGFSMGAAMSMLVGLSYPKKLNSIIACSGYVILRNKLKDLISDKNKDTPVLAYHGGSDEMVDIRYAKESYELLKKYIKNVELIVDESQGHTMTDEQIEHLAKWFHEKLE